MSVWKGVRLNAPPGSGGLLSINKVFGHPRLFSERLFHFPALTDASVQKDMAPHTNEYDVIILGSGLGGRIAGTLLAKRMNRILLIKERGYESAHLTNGYRFVPFSNFSEKRLKSPLFHRIAQALGVSLLAGRREGGNPGRRNAEKQKVMFQVVAPEARIDLFCDPVLLAGEWKREFPAEAAEIDALYEEMNRLRNPFEKIKKREKPWPFFPTRPRSLPKRFFSFDGLPKTGTEARLRSFSKEFQTLFELQLLSLGNLHTSDFPLSLAAYLLSSDESGDWLLGGDLERLEGVILDRFVQLGGKVEEVGDLAGADLEWKTGITLAVGEEGKSFRSDLLIINMPLHRLSALQGKWGRLLAKRQKRIHPRFVLAPLFLGVKERVVPVGMRDLLVSIRDPGKPHEGGNLISLSLSQGEDESEAPEGRRALTVQGLIPMSEWGRESRLSLREAMMEHLSWLFPFLEQHLEFVDDAWLKKETLPWSYPHFLCETPSRLDWRKEATSLRISRNVVYTGKESFPGLGLEGEILSGFIAANEILKKYPEPGPA